MATISTQSRIAAGAGAQLLRRSAENRLRATVERLCAIERPSASRGEHAAAELLRRALRGHGADAHIEVEQAHGGYWGPLGATSAAAVAAGLAAATRRPLARVGAGMLAAAAAGAVWSDLNGSGHGARRLARVQRKRTYNVTGELGKGPLTVVVHSHHDAARAGLLFHPTLTETAAKLPLPRTKSTPPLMWPVLAAPLLAGAAAAIGSRRLALAGAIAGAGAGACFADIARHGTVPGANDNASACAALVELARRFAAHPAAAVRVVLVSVGSEESLMEGMAAWGRRHFSRLDRSQTLFVSLDTIASPQLTLLDGEGMLKVFRYPAAAQDLVRRAADRHSLVLEDGVTLRNGTDGLYPLRAGFPAVSLVSHDPEIRAPRNYHWFSDTPDTLDYGALRRCVDLVEDLIRTLPVALPR